MTKRLGIMVVFVLLSLFTSNTYPQDSSSTITPLERSALNPSRTMLERGKNVSGTACASCHGTSGISTTPGIPNLAGQRTVYLYRVLQAYQEHGRRNDAMNHAVGFLNGEALLAVSAWYASLAPARPVQPKKVPTLPSLRKAVTLSPVSGPPLKNASSATVRMATLRLPECPT